MLKNGVKQAKSRQTGVIMKIAIISDIHGNLPALQAVVAEIDAAGVDTSSTLATRWAALLNLPKLPTCSCSGKSR